MPRLRRLRRALRRPTDLSRPPGPARKGRRRLGHRLLVALPALHEDLRLPRPPRARAPGRVRDQSPAARSAHLARDRRRRLLLDRGRALDARYPLQHGHDGDAVRQQRLRPHQEADLADEPPRDVDEHPPRRRLAATSQRRADGTRLHQRLFRGPDHRLEPRPPSSDPGARLSASRPLVRPHPPTLPRLLAARLRGPAARPGSDRGADPRRRSSGRRAGGANLQEPDGARPVQHGRRPGARRS